MFKKLPSKKLIIVFFVIFSVWIGVTGFFYADMVKAQQKKQERLYPMGDFLLRDKRTIDTTYEAIGSIEEGRELVNKGNLDLLVPLGSTPNWSSFMSAASGLNVDVFHLKATIPKPTEPRPPLNPPPNPDPPSDPDPGEPDTLTPCYYDWECTNAVNSSGSYCVGSSGYCIPDTTSFACWFTSTNPYDENKCTGDNSCLHVTSVGTCSPYECGDGECQASWEDKTTCPYDCGSTSNTCGDGYCRSGENRSNCPSDCGPELNVCGNGLCETSENCSNCSNDCGTCAYCGDGICNGTENRSSCPEDCNRLIDGPLDFIVI